MSKWRNTFDKDMLKDMKVLKQKNSLEKFITNAEAYLVKYPVKYIHFHLFAKIVNDLTT